MPGNPERVRDLRQLADIWRSLGLRVMTMPGWEDRGRSSRITFEVLAQASSSGASSRAARAGRRFMAAGHRVGLCASLPGRSELTSNPHHGAV